MGTGVIRGHRHDFEGMIVWTTTCEPETAKLVALSYSRHGAYESFLVNPETDPDVLVSKPTAALPNGRYQAELVYSYGGKSSETHAMHKDKKKGSHSTVDHVEAHTVQWDLMPAAARKGMDRDWGAAVCPVCDESFSKQVMNAWSGYKGLKGLESLM